MLVDHPKYQKRQVIRLRKNLKKTAKVDYKTSGRRVN
jgi:hypothetical protein